MRVEDLDGPRVKHETIVPTLEIMAWLGLDHDGEATVQSDDLEPYRTAMRALEGAGLVYQCDLTRREIEAAASAPHAGDHELRYPLELRPKERERFVFADEAANYRLVVPERTVRIDDEIAGVVEFRPHEEVGDFVVWTKRGAPSYQLAVVVDDARRGVTDVVRGDDLLPSAARQSLLYEALGVPEPRWWHLPLVLGPDGRRLAKRHGDTRLASYRDAGVTPERIVGLLAEWCGLGGRRPMTANGFRRSFEAARLRRAPITFTEADHQWLLAG